jgi:hypothetical protein
LRLSAFPSCSRSRNNQHQLQFNPFDPPRGNLLIPSFSIKSSHSFGATRSPSHSHFSLDRPNSQPEPPRSPHRSAVKTGHYNTNTMGFGDFGPICRKAAVPLCTLVGPTSTISGSAGIMPQCYARSIELANTIIFQGATDFMHILALGMTAIMILHVRSKFTAVGRLQALFLKAEKTWTDRFYL